jgi:hypothetical protein
MLFKSKERIKSHGEVYSPRVVICRMLDLIPDHVWSDPNKTFLEPACGSGNFVLEVIQKKIDFGSTLEQALKTTFGSDILSDNVLQCKQRVIAKFNIQDPKLKAIVNQNITVKDFLSRA